MVPVSARTRLYKPQAKIAEFLVGTLSGIEYLQDLDLGPNPLALAAKRLGEASAPPLPSSLLPQALPAPDEGSSARRRLEKRRVTWQGERRRARAELLKTQSVLAGHRRQAAALRQGMDALGRWLGQLEADNATNPDPPICTLRVDAGFASGPNVTWLIEMGYQVYTKAPNDQTTKALRARVTPETRWVRVGANAELVAWDEYRLHDCPYPLRGLQGPTPDESLARRDRLAGELHHVCEQLRALGGGVAAPSRRVPETSLLGDAG